MKEWLYCLLKASLRVLSIVSWGGIFLFITWNKILSPKLGIPMLSLKEIVTIIFLFSGYVDVLKDLWHSHK